MPVEAWGRCGRPNGPEQAIEPAPPCQHPIICCASPALAVTGPPQARQDGPATLAVEEAMVTAAFLGLEAHRSMGL
jgi:hypothetical protein